MIKQYILNEDEINDIRDSLDWISDKLDALEIIVGRNDGHRVADMQKEIRSLKKKLR